MRYVAIFSKRSIVDVWQCSEYVSVSKYTKVLNMLLVISMLGFWVYISRYIKRFWIYLSQNIRKFCYTRVLNIAFLKYKTCSVMPGFWIYLSQNIRKFCYAKVLNMPFLEYKKSSVFSKLEKLLWENRRNFFPSSFFRKKYKKIFGEKFRGLRPEIVRNFLIFQLESLISQNITKMFLEKIHKFFVGNIFEAGTGKCSR